MDRLTTIETAIATSLLDIGATGLPGPYRYYNDVRIVNQEDESVPDIDAKYPYINVYLDPEEEVLEGVSRVFQNRAGFRLECFVQNDGEVEQPRFAITQKMNEILSDVKYNLSLHGATLGRTVDQVRIRTSNREIFDDNDVFTTGKVVVQLDVYYSQSRNNPDINICV